MANRGARRRGARVVIETTRERATLPGMAWLYDLGSSVLGAVVAHPALAAAASIAVAIGVAVLARQRGWLDGIRRHPRTAVVLLVSALVVLLPVAWYLTSPLVLSATIDEPAPVSAADSPRPSPVGNPASPAPSTRPDPSAAATATTTPTPTPTPPLPIARAGSFHGSDDFHFGRGTAHLIEVAPGSFVVRLEDFAVRNGPDLYVYLSPATDGYAEGAIEIGRLKADKGNQNYAVPAGALVDPARAASVVIWCKQFSHLFATAPLAAA